MSLVDIQHCSPTTEEVAQDIHRRPSSSARSTAPPSHINLTAPQFEDPPQNHTAASLHKLTSSVRPSSPPPSNSRLVPPAASACELETIPPADALPSPDLALDFTLDDEGLSTLEKIYLFSRSRSAHHRVFISHALPSFLSQVTPLEAVEYVLPLLPSLAIDEDETVKEALASELVEILWWFLTHCRLVEEPPDPGTAGYSQQYQSDEDVTLISVQAFTPILGTLLLSPNGMVSGPARYAVVDLLARMRKADDAEDQEAEALRRAEASCGLFGKAQRAMFEDEVVHQLIIGIGRLDGVVDDDDVTEIWYDATARTPATELPTASTLAPTSTWAAPSPSTASMSPPPGIPGLQPTTEQLPVDSSPLASISYHYEAAEAGEHPGFESNTGVQLEVPSGLSQIDSSLERHEYAHADDEVDPNEQAAVGRLSSMSLIAAATAGGSLRYDTQRVFVKEVERGGKDPIYWVRREASFALGALAKVVPEELVISSLLLRSDTVWHVRHSSLFALPVILSRLPLVLRESVALSTVVPLSRDESPAVRSGVLEALGEVILFLGREEDFRARDKQQPMYHGLAYVRRPDASNLDLFYDDPARPLACAFNYPAVALTVGRARWGELRSLYLTLAQNRSIKVRRTLAASLGELAIVIGPDNAKQDLMDVWWDAMRCEEDGDVRLKAIEAVPLFVDALGEGAARGDIFGGLVKIWDEGRLKHWRAREAVIKILIDLVGSPSHPDCIHRLVTRGLEDDFGAVRDVCVAAVTRMWSEGDKWIAVLDRLRPDILAMAYSTSFRKRMTYIACQQAVASSCAETAFVSDEVNWKALRQLADDRIIGVRIGVARLAGSLLGKSARSSTPIPRQVVELVEHLQEDSSREVRSYVSLSVDGVQGGWAFPSESGAFRTFSRPPPTMGGLCHDEGSLTMRR
ncbi:armadillo-type protein [Phlebopus sp. FC_14]|nr:armadillo-type protein [Phlebopus sp. FC_14]